MNDKIKNIKAMQIKRLPKDVYLYIEYYNGDSGYDFIVEKQSKEEAKQLCMYLNNILKRYEKVKVRK